MIPTGSISSSVPIFRTEAAPPLSAEHESLLGRLAADITAACRVPRPVHIILTDDAFIRELNSKYRGKAVATDVLSFDLKRTEDEISSLAACAEIYVSLERARWQAVEQQVSLLQEVARLVTHGLLHLAGYEHDSPVTLRVMEAETNRLLKAGGFLALDVSQ